MDMVHTFLPIVWTLISTFPVDQLVVTVVPAISAPLPRAKIDCMPKVLTTLTPIPKRCFVPTLVDAPAVPIPVRLVTACEGSQTLPTMMLITVG